MAVISLIKHGIGVTGRYCVIYLVVFDDYLPKYSHMLSICRPYKFGYSSLMFETNWQETLSYFLKNLPAMGN